MGNDARFMVPGAVVLALLAESAGAIKEPETCIVTVRDMAASCFVHEPVKPHKVRVDQKPYGKKYRRYNK